VIIIAMTFLLAGAILSIISAKKIFQMDDLLKKSRSLLERNNGLIEAISEVHLENAGILTELESGKLDEFDTDHSFERLKQCREYIDSLCDEIEENKGKIEEIFKQIERIEKKLW
jgi:hypothetical protein